MRHMIHFFVVLVVTVLLVCLLFRQHRIMYPSPEWNKRIGVERSANIVEWKSEQPELKPYIDKAIEDGKITQREYIKIAEKYFDLIHADYIEELR